LTDKKKKPFLCEPATSDQQQLKPPKTKTRPGSEDRWEQIGATAR
jgi:hypothetical protein